MRKITKIHVGNVTLLSQQEMINLSGGGKDYTCRVNEDCKLYIGALGIVLDGKCALDGSGTTISCYCYNGAYHTTFGHQTSCWR